MTTPSDKRRHRGRLDLPFESCDCSWCNKARNLAHVAQLLDRIEARTNQLQVLAQFPDHADTPQQQRVLRSSKVAAHVRRMFPRGTRVEATRSFDEPGNGRIGTVIAHIPGSSADGGTLKVLWDDPSPFGGGTWISPTMWAGGLLVVDPAIGKGVVRPGIGGAR